jgi:hypothetical protein
MHAVPVFRVAVVHDREVIGVLCTCLEATGAQLVGPFPSQQPTGLVVRPGGSRTTV